MSVIAWDGRTLASDRCGVRVNLRLETTKLKVVTNPNGQVYGMAFTGELSSGRMLWKWFRDGKDPDKWPLSDDMIDTARLVVSFGDRVVYFERTPFAIEVEGDIMAWGSGCDFALGAMAMGATAIKAVQIASDYDRDCGFGVDSFTPPEDQH